MTDVLDHDYLVLFTSLLFPFGDGQVVRPSDLTATIALLSTVLTVYHFTVLLPCVSRAKLSRSKHLVDCCGAWNEDTRCVIIRFYRWNLCCRMEVKTVLLGYTCIRFSGAFFFWATVLFRFAGRW
jgi:hypothetical protein